MSRSARTRELFSHFAPWMIVAYIGLAAVTLAGWNLSARIARDEARTARIQAIREAENQAAKTAAVERCLTSRPQLERISQHVSGVNEGFTILVLNAAAVLNQTPRSDPLYELRQANLKRLIQAREKVLAIKAFPVPTVDECKGKGG